MKEFTVFDGLGFEVILVVEDRKGKMRVNGLLSKIGEYIVKGFNRYASLEKLAKVEEDQVIISSMVPPIPSDAFKRLVKNQLRRRFLRKRPLESLMFLITSACQCNCKHCIVYGMKGRNELKTDEVKEIIDQATKMGAYHVSFEGGEPTLRDDIFELIRYADQRETVTHLMTNGQKLSKEFIQRLADAGLKYLHVSLDSPYAEEHDEFRGLDGAFERASKGVSYGVEAGMLGVIQYTANPYNSDLERLEDLYQHCKSLGVHEILFDEIIPGGKWGYKKILSPEDYKRLEEFKKEKNKENNGPRVFSSYSCREPDILGCFGGRRWLWISPTGEMMPCTHTLLSFGNVRNKGLKKGWAEMGGHPLFKKKKCTWKDKEYRKKYLPHIMEAVNERKQPYPIK